MLKRTIRDFLVRVPFGDMLVDLPRRLRKRQHYRAEAMRLSPLKGREAVFTHHFDTNEWGNQESVSGAGSTLQYTANIRLEIPAIVRRFNVRTFVDAPCGDFNWFRHITFDPPIAYIGGEIVEALALQNEEKFGSETVSFRKMDIVTDRLPAADMWMCRDCLFHLSNHEVMLALANFLQSDIKYLLTTTHHLCERNIDIPTGAFRLLNLTLPPFNLGPPVLAVDDWIDGFPPRQLGVWDRVQLERALDSNRALKRALRARDTRSR